MSGVETITHLLSIVFAEYQEVKLITALNHFFKFDHNIFLLDSSVDMKRFISTQEAIPQSIYVFKRVDDNITGLENLTNIQSKNTLVVAVAEGATFDSNFNLLKQIKKIQRLQINIKIGMFLPHFASTEDLHTIFEWCKEQLIVNIFAATHAYVDVIQGVTSESVLNIFSFHPFGTFEVINVTGSQTYYSYFPSLNSNFQQHQLTVDMSFHYIYEKEFWFTVFKLMNSSFILQYDFEPEDSELNDEETVIFPVVYQMTEWRAEAVYPLGMINHVIVVPEAQPYSDFTAYLRTLTSDEFFGYSLFTIAAVMLILSVIRHIKRKKILFFQSVTDVLNLLMNDNTYINYQRLFREEVCIIIPLTFVGFVIVNGILSNLQSYLTRPILQPQIKTIEEIYRSPLPILVSSVGWKSALMDVLTNLSRYEDWSDKIFVLEDEEEYNEQLIMYNSSTTILASMKKVNLVLGLQKLLNIKGFQNPGIKMFIDVFTYYVRPKFLFFERLNEIVHRIQSAGLYNLWSRMELSHMEKEILKSNGERLRNRSEIAVQNFEFPMFMLYGWLVSGIVLVVEIIWKHFTLSRRFGEFCRILSEKLKN